MKKIKWALIELTELRGERHANAMALSMSLVL
jgi:hypothetical protein